MHVVVYRKNFADMVTAFSEIASTVILMSNIYNLYAQRGIDYEHYLIRINDDKTLIEFRCGEPSRMAGIRPDYYHANTKQALDFLELCACKCNGKRIEDFGKLVRIVEQEFRK